MRKSQVWLIIVSILVLSIGVGATVAHLLTSSGSVHNTFTVGSVEITLTETTGKEYKMAPGVSVAKDPKVTVLAGSEACWLFVKLEKMGDFDTFCTYEVEEGWTALAGHPGVYYRRVEESREATSFSVLKGNCIPVFDHVTEEQLNALAAYPTLNITAYAAQTDGIATAEAAWQALNQ